MIKMLREAQWGREVAKMREEILAWRNRDCCCVICFNDSEALRDFFLVTTSRIRDKKKLPSGRRRNIASWSRKRQEQRCQTEIEATNPCHLFFPYPLLFIRRYYCFINNVAINLVYVGGAGVLHSKLNVLLTTACRNRVIRGNRWVFSINKSL